MPSDGLKRVARTLFQTGTAAMILMVIQAFFVTLTPEQIVALQALGTVIIAAGQNYFEAERVIPTVLK